MFELTTSPNDKRGWSSKECICETRFFKNRNVFLEIHIGTLKGDLNLGCIK